MVRLRGDCPRGQQLIAHGAYGHGKTITFVAGLRRRAMVAPLVLDGPMNATIFVTYLKECLAPKLKRGDVVMMDNLSVHRVAAVRAKPPRPGRARFPAGGARNRGDAAVSDRPCDRRQHSGILLSGAGLGSVGQRRYRGDRTRKDHPERPDQGDPAVRNRCGPRDPCPRRADRQGRRDLIELDPTMNTADLEHMKSDPIAARLDVARDRAALAGHEDPLDDFKPPPGASPQLIETYRQFLVTQVTEQNSKLAEIDSDPRAGGKKSTILFPRYTPLGDAFLI